MSLAPSTLRRQFPAVLVLAASTTLVLLARVWPDPDLGATTPETATESALDPLTGFSSLHRTEWVVFATLCILRGLLASRRTSARLQPFLDLPILGFALAATGGSAGLDPALTFGYLAAVVLLDAESSPAPSRRRLGASLAVGILSMLAVVWLHASARFDRADDRSQQMFRQRIHLLRQEHERSIRDLDRFFESGNAGNVELDLVRGNPHLFLAPAAHTLYAHRFTPAHQLLESLKEFLIDLERCSTVAELRDLDQDLERRESRLLENWSDAERRWNIEEEEHSLQQELQGLQDAWTDERQLLTSIHRGTRDLELSIASLDSTRRRVKNLQREQLLRTLVGTASLAAFGILVLVLRDRLRGEVRSAQRAGAQSEIDLQEREKQHWIAVTAGLTHGLGNDILAYETILGRALNQLEERSDIGPQILEPLRFVRDSNRGRLSFLQFLESFARERKAAQQGRGPIRPHRQLDLRQLLDRVRSHLATVETADLPPPGSDPGVDRQIARFRSLPIVVEAEGEDAALLRYAHRGVVEFIVYELLKNALRSCTGERPLTVHLRREPDSILLSMRNDVEMEAGPGRCASCAASTTVRRVRRRRDMPAVCEACLGPRLAELLRQSFEPGQGGGTGLGLFLVRYFLQQYYGGDLDARVVRTDPPTVEFALSLPDGPERSEAGPPPLPEDGETNR